MRLGSAFRIPNPSQVLFLDAAGDVPCHRRSGTDATLLGLFLVLDLDLGELDRAVFTDDVAAAGAALRDGRDQHVGHRVLEILERFLTGLADAEHRVREVLAVAAMQHEVRRTLVDVLGDAQVVNVHFAGAHAAAHVAITLLGHAEAVGKDVDPLLVALLVAGFAFERSDANEHVYSHDQNLLNG